MSFCCTSFYNSAKLKNLISIIPAEKLLEKLEEERGNGRNDYPVVCMWCLYLAKFVFQHQTIESLLRECRRNSQLRQVCGFQSNYIPGAVSNDQLCLAPSSAAMSRFIKSLQKHQEIFTEMRMALNAKLQAALPDLGLEVAIDGKMIQSYANKVSTKEPNGRRETQADTTAKNYYSNNGTKTTKYYFGFRVHLLADVNYELPIAFKVTPASIGEREVAEEILTESEILLKNTKAVMADKGYDSVNFRKFIEEKGMIAVIPPRHMWGEEDSRQYKDYPLYYNQDGAVFYRTEDYEMIELIYKGYDQSSDSLRYGFHPKYNDKRIFRINRSEDIRIFPKVSQQSHKFERLYNKRSAIERINGRLDRDFMFENHTIRGLEKVTLYVTMACLCTLGFDYSKVKKQKTAHLSSWVA